MKTLAILLPAALFATACVDGDQSPTDEIISNLEEAGFPADDIRVVDGLVYVGNDVQVTLEMSREMVGDDEGKTVDLETIQYTTRNLLSPNIKTICVLDTMGNATLTAGLNLAIQRYNALGLNFRLKNGVLGCEAQITAVFDFGSGGGVSGFPSNGKPFSTIRI